MRSTLTITRETLAFGRLPDSSVVYCRHGRACSRMDLHIRAFCLERTLTSHQGVSVWLPEWWASWTGLRLHLLLDWYNGNCSFAG